MRKTAAYFLSIIALFAKGIMILDPSFRALSDWLGPLLGSHIYTLFTLIFLLIADPVSYPLVAATWIIVGLFIGVVVGKKLGASITALVVWLTTLPLLAASVAGIYFNLDARGFFDHEFFEALKMVPVIPDQLTFNNLFHIPIFSDLIFQIAGMASSFNESTSPFSVMVQIAQPYVITFAAKPVLIVLSAIVGAIISSTLLSTIGSMLPSRKTAMALLVITLISLQSIPANADINFNDGLYTELIGGYTEDQGRAATGELVLGNQLETIPMNTPETQDLVASVVVTQKIYDPAIFYTLPIENITEYLQYRNLLPSTFAVNIYLGDDTVSIESKSDTVIATIEQNMGIQFQKITSMLIPTEGGPEAAIPTMTAVIYYSQNTIDETTVGMIKGFDKIGFTSFIDEKLKSDTHQDVEFYASGFILVDPFKAMLPIPEVPPEFQNLYNALVNSRFTFFAGVQLEKDAVTQQGGNYIFDLRDLLNVESVPGYAPYSDGSFIIMARSNTTGTDNPLDPTIHIKTSIPATSMELMFLTFFLQGMGVIDMKTGQPTISDTQLTIPMVHVPKVTLTKSIQQISNGAREVTVTATNSGAESITDLKLTDPFPTKYDILKSGSSETTWFTLAPGQSTSITYAIDATKPGTYTDVPAILTYNNGETEVSTPSNTLQELEKPPNSVSMLADNYHAITGVLDRVLNGNGQILTYIIAALVLIVAAWDVFKYFSARSKTGEQPGDATVPPPFVEPPDNPEAPL
jgi:Translocon-associated protein beta (TRAPB)